MGTVKEAAERHLAAFNTKDVNEFVANESPDIEFVLPGAITLRGREQVRAYIEIFWRAFPDATVTEQAQVLAPDTAVTEAIFTGTHTGALRTPTGEIPATGRRVQIRQVAVQRITDGLISSEHLYFDQLELLGQLGIAMPEAS